METSLIGVAVSEELEVRHECARYRPLGLLANPFLVHHSESGWDGRDFEVAAASNLLLGAVETAAAQETAKPIVVSKTDAVPAYYPLRAVGLAERAMIADDSMGVLHAYVPLFLMRIGRVRATLQTLAERLTFHDFDGTLALYIESVLRDPDEDLIAYQVLGEDGLAAFAGSFRADPAAGVARLFGEPMIIERRPELTEVGDVRGVNLEPDVDDEDAVPEIDSTVGEAPGTDVVLLEEADAREEDDPDQAVADYIVEYTKVHLSPVVSRALRVYRERGLGALSAEFSITKAPRKTLAAVAKFASVRFRKIVLVYDGYEGWAQVPIETRTQVAATLAEMRWLLESDGVIVMMLERGQVPELEEQFAGGAQVAWDFPGVIPLQGAHDLLDTTLVNWWLAAASYPGAQPLTLGDETLAALFEAAGGSLRAFTTMGAAAIENAAERGASSLDEIALEAGLKAGTDADASEGEAREEPEEAPR